MLSLRYSPILHGINVNGSIKSEGESFPVILLYFVKSIDDEEMCKIELVLGKPYTTTRDISNIPYSAKIDWAPVNDTA